MPRDAEGREIPLDTVVPFNVHGDAYDITGRMFGTDFPTYNKWANRRRAFSEYGFVLEPEKMYPTPPDSWEKPYGDIDKCVAENSICMYCSKDGTCKSRALGNESSACSPKVPGDILDRIHKPRGEEK